MLFCPLLAAMFERRQVQHPGVGLNRFTNNLKLIFAGSGSGRNNDDIGAGSYIAQLPLGLVDGALFHCLLRALAVESLSLEDDFKRYLGDALAQLQEYRSKQVESTEPTQP